MNKLILVLAFGISACQSSEILTNEDSHSMRLQYVYQDVQNIRESIVIYKDNNEWVLVETDLGLSSEISEQPISVFSKELGMTFYVPENFSKDLSGWRYRDCEYEVLKTSTYSDDDSYPLFLYEIESVCDSQPIVSRYIFSNEHGLQLFSLGTGVPSSETTKSAFINSRTFALMISKSGFGAKLK